ncbi:MAG TPA: hypothetical protein VHU81_20230, partial [Thermoanaerobaculia bacterium]|nr:hypothetical protein [Thermoanaerobaculia bacterium]
MQTSYEPENPPVSADLAGRIAALLPRGGRVLLSGGGEALARAAAAAGVFLTERDLSFEAFEEDGDNASGSGAPARRFDALVLAEPREEPSATSHPLTGLLHRARNLLAEKGRLFLLAPAGADPRDRIVALSETGFVILDEDWTHGTGLFQARRESIFVTEYQEGDEAAILALFRGSFHVERTLERWRWEYAENPYGNRVISEAFAEDGALVAHYAAYPVRFHRERPGGDGPDNPAETLLAQQVGDTMTAPEVRKIGRGPTSVLARTVRHFYARFCAGRIAFNYGFNTGNIQRFSMSFVRARRIEDVPFRVRAVQGEGVPPLRPPRWLVRKLGGYRVERVTAIEESDGRWDELFERVRGSYGFLIERDARYLGWRYARCPDPQYFIYAVFRRRRLIGWGVFRQLGDRLFWGDALFDPRYPEAARLLLAQVLAEPAHGATRV